MSYNRIPTSWGDAVEFVLNIVVCALFVFFVVKIALWIERVNNLLP